MNSKPFEHTILVQPSDIDMMGHVNNVIYVRWVQDVAEAHWKTKATAEQQKEILWVVKRHEIDYAKPAFENDTVVGKTWVEPAEGPKTIRHVEIKRKADDQLLVKAKTIWVAINSVTGRPFRLNDAIMNIFF